MSEVNRKRLLAGGLVTAIVMMVGEILVEVIAADAAGAWLARLGISPPGEEAMPLLLLGSLLLHTSDTARAIAELERAERDVKADPAVYYALARAYGRAGRTADAARARERFTALTRERDEAARREAAGGVK